MPHNSSRRPLRFVLVTTPHPTRAYDLTMQSNAFEYRADIDGLRAIAVLGVLFCHAELGLPGGFVGVDVFFVISGYLITSLILRDLQQGTFSLAGFWERRIRRIAPAMLCVTFVTLLAGWFLLVPDAFASLAESVVGLALLVSNVHFWREVGYFAAAADEKPLLHTWSLAVEEQFYVLVPLALMLLSRVRRMNYAVTILWVAAVLSFGVSAYGVTRHPSATFYLLPTRAWELLTGVLLALGGAHCGVLLGRCRDIAAAAGLALLLATCSFYDAHTPFPGLAALPPVIGTCLLIACGQSGGSITWGNRLLAWHPLVFIGQISYSLYLWHWPLFALAKHQSILPIPPVGRMLLIAASFALAVLSWRVVEIPFRTRQVLGSRSSLFRTAAIAYIAMILAGAVVSHHEGFPARLPRQARLFASTGRLDSRYAIELEAKDVPADLDNLSKMQAPADILVWGDSHAMAVLPAIESICHDSGLRACIATHSSTAPVLGHFSRTRYGLNEQAIAFNSAVVEYVRNGGVKTVVLAANWNMYSSDAQFPTALLRTVDTLRDTGATVCFMNVVPSFGFDVPKALVLYSWRGWDPDALALPENVYRLRNDFQNSVLPSLTARQVVILDPVSALQRRTDALDILPFDKGGSFYRDSGHLSNYGAMAVKPLFVTLLHTARHFESRVSQAHSIDGPRPARGPLQSSGPTSFQ